jgi:creatinine amidohydrolase
VLLGPLTSPAAGELAARSVLAVPLGSTEQHGPHLPLSTDADIASGLCARLAVLRQIVVAPGVPYGSSGEHTGFAGTISIGQEAFELLVLELVRSATDTFNRVLLVSGHGGNAEPLARAVDRLRFEGRDVLAWSPRWEGEPHAGRPETAMELALHPEWVDLARAEAGDKRPLAEIAAALRDGGVRAVSANGVLGDPTGATADEGEALLDALTADLVRHFDEWMNLGRSSRSRGGGTPACGGERPCRDRSG